MEIFYLDFELVISKIGCVTNDLKNSEADVEMLYQGLFWFILQFTVSHL